METKVSFLMTFLLMNAILAACSPSQAELDAQATKIAADIFATQTAEAPTTTPTSTPTPTLTITPTQTPTPLPTSTPTTTPTITLPPIPTGWRGHDVSGFFIALPERWDIVDIREDGFEAIWNMLEGINTDWAQNTTAMFTSEGMQEAVIFWAMDTEPAGTGYATANITYDSQPIPIKVEDLCSQMLSLYEQIGVEVVESDCRQKINGLDAAKFTLNLQWGPLAIKENQYIYIRGSDAWALTFAVDETEWSEYEPIFVNAAESFRVE